MNVLRNIEDGKYQSKLPYPDIKILGVDKYRKARKKYREDMHHLEQEVFADDLKNHFNLPTEIAGKIFYKAWSEGHSSGLESVYWEYRDLADIVQFSIDFMTQFTLNTVVREIKTQLKSKGD